MGATAFISSMSHRRIARARAWLEARAPAEEVLIIGASRDAANELARQVAQMRGAAFGWHRLTLTQLAATLAGSALTARGIAALSRLGVQAMAARVVHSLIADGALGRYCSVAQGPGFARSIAGVVMELRLAKVDPDRLGSIAPELATLLRTYESNLAAGGLADWAGVVISATNAAASSELKPQLVGLPILLLDVPLTTEVELAFVCAICSRAPETLAVVPAADEPTLIRLRKEMQVELEDLDTGDESPGTLACLQRRIFNENTASAASVPDDQVLVLSAPGESRECVEIARRVLGLAKKGVAFERIAVLLRSPDEYRAPLQEAFARAGVPARFARGAVPPDPSGRAFCVLLHCAAEGLSARRFAEYLSLGQVPDATPAGTPLEAAPRSERWVTPDAELVPGRLAEALQFSPPVRCLRRSYVRAVCLKIARVSGRASGGSTCRGSQTRSAPDQLAGPRIRKPAIKQVRRFQLSAVSRMPDAALEVYFSRNSPKHEFSHSLGPWSCENSPKSTGHGKSGR
jgi:hypothetical protein